MKNVLFLVFCMFGCMSVLSCTSVKVDDEVVGDLPREVKNFKIQFDSNLEKKYGDIFIGKLQKNLTELGLNVIDETSNSDLSVLDIRIKLKYKHNIFSCVLFWPLCDIGKNFATLKGSSVFSVANRVYIKMKIDVKSNYAGHVARLVLSEKAAEVIIEKIKPHLNKVESPTIK